MPTYQYVCTDCGSDLEAVQSFSEPSLSECPTCGGKLRKRFSAVGVVFKGSGFYRNDSRSDARGGSAERKSESSDKSDSKTEKADTGAKSDSSATAKTPTIASRSPTPDPALAPRTGRAVPPAQARLQLGFGFQGQHRRLTVVHRRSSPGFARRPASLA